MFQAEDGIRDLVRSRGLGDVYKRQVHSRAVTRIQEVRQLRIAQFPEDAGPMAHPIRPASYAEINNFYTCLLYTSDAADERSSVDLGGRRIIKKKNDEERLGIKIDETEIA